MRLLAEALQAFLGMNHKISFTFPYNTAMEINCGIGVQ
jgi:hypothetical protein